jgi:uncharacterized protein YjiS (DUF1127 family)
VVCQINCREQSGTLSVAAQGSFKEISVMMEQSLNGMFRPSSLDARCDERRQASPDLPPIRRSFRRAETTHIAPRTVIRRIVAAIGLWCARARSRQKLRELSEHLLKDIGLRREDVGYEFQKPFWHCD